MRSGKEFLNAIRDAEKNNQYEKVLHILTDEIGQLLANNKLALIRILKESGKVVDENIEDVELAKIISAGLINNNKKFIQDLIELIANEKADYSNFIGWIVQGVGALVKGIGDAITANERKKAERDAAREKVSTQQELGRAVQVELISGIMTSKSKAEQAKYLVQGEREKVLGEERQKMLIAVSAVGFLIFGVILYVILKKSE